LIINSVPTLGSGISLKDPPHTKYQEYHNPGEGFNVDDHFTHSQAVLARGEQTSI
jgi:hypothetical protein